VNERIRRHEWLLLARTRLTGSKWHGKRNLIFPLAYGDTLQLKCYFTLALAAVMTAAALSGCGGKLAKTGCATITDVTCDGAMRIQYPNGKADWKRMEYDNVPRDVRIAQENRWKPARYVETKNGGTITFPAGDTITFHDMYNGAR
jgi:hypothetical protein